MNNNEAVFSESELDALEEETTPDFFKDYMSHLESLSKPYIESLSPVVRKRVEALMKIQDKHDELRVKFLEERAALESKYQKLYQPLYAERYEIVNGVTEVEGAADETKSDSEEDNEKGVPDFWLTAMKKNNVLVVEISERDEAALSFLKDIKWSRIENIKGFKLDFFFESNPYFSNSVLTKTYHMIDEDDWILEKAIGTEIQWLPGKCLTQKVLTRKHKKGSKNAKPITKTVNCESFFNFFNPPEIPDSDDDIYVEMTEELHNHIEQDYDVGSTIRDKIIPRAVSWFTSNDIPYKEIDLQYGEDEAFEDGLFEDGLFEEDDDKEEEKEDDKEDDEDEEESKSKKKV